MPSLAVGADGGLSAVDPLEMSRYLRRRVLEVEPLPADIGVSRTDRSEMPVESNLGTGAGGWRVHFEDGVYSDVRVQPVGVAGSAFPDLQARFHAQHDQWGDRSSPADSIAIDAVGCVEGSPHETYYQGNVLVSRGSRHEAVVEASSLASPRFRETMAGIAVLALRLVAD